MRSTSTATCSTCWCSRAETRWPPSGSSAKLLRGLRYVPRVIVTDKLRSGASGGDGLGRAARPDPSESQPSLTAPSPRFESVSRSLGWNCIPTKRGSSSSGSVLFDIDRRGRRETRDVQLPGSHALVRENEGGTVLGQADDDQETDAGDVARGQRRTQTLSAFTPWAMAAERGARPPQLLRRARQHRRGRNLSHPGRPILVQGAAPPPTHPTQLDADGWLHETMAITRPTEAPIPAVRFDARTQGRSPVR